MSTVVFTLNVLGNNLSYCPPEATSYSKTAVPVSKDSASKAQYSSKNMLISLCGLSFSRKLYEPGHIQAELLIEDQSSGLTVDNVSDMLLNCPVSLAVTYNSTAYTIAKNYYVYELSPQFETTDGKKFIYVKLDIFSKDKLLTLNKFSKAYLGKKLIEQVVTPFVNNSAIGVSLREVKKSALDGLAYTESNTTTEFIHPYLVQYNESFYDFLKRVANRCGEAMYFEDGQLCFGRPVLSTTAEDITTASRIIFQRISSAPLRIRDYARETVKEYRCIDESNNKYTYDLEKDALLSDPVPMDSDYGFPKDAFPRDATKANDYPEVYNSELAAEDQYMILYKDTFDRADFGKIWWGDTNEHALQMVADVLNSTSLLELLGKWGTKLITGLISAGIKKDRANEDGNKVVDDNRLNDNNDYAVLLAKIDKDINHWISLTRYKTIRDKEEQASLKTVCVEMGSSFSGVQLGDTITLNSKTDTKYVVVQIDMESEEAWQRTYEGLDGYPNPSGGKQSQRIYAVPLDGTKFYPPLLPGDPFRRSGPQPAFITDSGDLLGQGRVRIRFPWQPSYGVKAKEDIADQKKTDLDGLFEKDKNGNFILDKKGMPKLKDGKKPSDVTKAQDEYNSALDDVADAKKELKQDASPWIRMATPLATPGGGMYFKPKAGDEVMVDFENGNIERPYVVGALYSKNVPAPPDGSMVIVSRNGHTIKMTDPTDVSDFIAGMLPGIKYLKGLGVKMNWRELKGDEKKILGGIEFTDQYGFYNVKMSTHNRSISVSSPLGDISMDALTGISIDAPNGDISIRGKNVEITAYNRISLESGKNVKLGRAGWLTAFKDVEKIGETLSKSVLNAFGGKFFDLSFIRSLIEIFIRPIDGTLSLNSGRYMTLEAGKGGAVAAGEAKYNTKFSDRYEMNNESIILIHTMPWLRQKLDEYVAGYVKLFNELRNKVKDLPDDYFGNAAPHKISTPATKEVLLQSLFGEGPFNSEDRLMGGISRFVQNTNKLNFVNQADAQALAAVKTDCFAKVGAIMRAVNNLKKYVGGYNNIFVAPNKRVGKLSHVKSFFEKYAASRNTFTHDSQAILRLATPDPNPGAQAGGFYNESLEKVEGFQNNGDIHLFDNPLNPTDFEAWKKFIHRRLMHKAIEGCRGPNNDPFTTFSIPAATYPPIPDPTTGQRVSQPPGDLANPFSDNDWPKYVKGIEFVQKPVAQKGMGWEFLGGLANGALSVIKKADIRPEAGVWRAEAEGEILFSDKKGETYQFQNGNVDSHQNLSPTLSANNDALKSSMLPK